MLNIGQHNTTQHMPTTVTLTFINQAHMTIHCQ